MVRTKSLYPLLNDPLHDFPILVDIQELFIGGVNLIPKPLKDNLKLMIF